MSDSESLFEFPCLFPIKVMGKNIDNFDALVIEIVRKHVPDIKEGSVTRKESSSGTYISITIEIEAHSRAQLDAIYLGLTDHPAVLMAL